MDLYHEKVNNNTTSHTLRGYLFISLLLQMKLNHVNSFAIDIYCSLYDFNILFTYIERSYLV